MARFKNVSLCFEFLHEFVYQSESYVFTGFVIDIE